MEAAKRRKKIMKILQESSIPVSGKELAKLCAVSRQVIVQDMAILRASGDEIVATSSGYICLNKKAKRIFKVVHSDNEVEEELSLIVDCGAVVEDVFVYHRAYGVVRAKLDIKSRIDIERFMEDIRTGKSSLLKNTTAGYHYHTIVAESSEILDLVQEKLKERGFLAQLQDYEPVNFWEEKKDE